MEDFSKMSVITHTIKKYSIKLRDTSLWTSRMD